MSSAVDRCHLVASVLAADGMVTQVERDFLDRVMTEHGLDDAQKRAVRDFEGADGALERLLTLPKAERKSIVDQLLEASLADAKLSEREREHVQTLTAALREE